VGPFEVLILAC